jgi:membrane fusion protein (multidrug efflux system)
MATRKLIILVAAILAIIGCGYFGYQYVTYVVTDNAQVEAHTVMLASKVAGFINKVNVVEGQQVKKGDVMVEIDDRDYQNIVKQVRGELTSIQAKERDAEKNYRRLNSLYSSGSVSQQQSDSASAGFSEVKARFEAASAQVAEAELNVANTKITAPYDGVVAKKSVEVGQLASPGVPLIGFVGSNERWIIANFKETDLPNIKVGSLVDITLDAIPGREFKGKVESISSATGATFTLLPPDNATGNFTKVVQRVPVKVVLNQLNEGDIELLKAGLSADVKVHKH